MRLSALLLILVAIACGDSDPIVDASVDAPEDVQLDAAPDVAPDVLDAEPDAEPDAQPEFRADDLCDPDAEVPAFPAPDAFANRGPGASTVTYAEEEVFETCAFLDGGEQDTSDHHNILVMYDGYLLMPWAPEWGSGGLSFFRFDDPCSPEMIGTGHSETMRETHSIGFSPIGGRYAVVNHVSELLTFDGGGIEFWDVADPAAPEQISALNLPGFFYPDAYARVSLSVFWQAPYVYVGGSDNGVWIVDASDPMRPFLAAQYTPDPVVGVGQVQAIGNLLIVTAAEGPETILLDISSPAEPRPIPGGEYLAQDASGTPRGAYFTNISGRHLYYANKDSGGGIIVYDISNPRAPEHAGELISDGNGGYVAVQNGRAFVGESRFAAIYDIEDLDAITEVTRLDLEGDLDTITPIGNVAVLSVDADANDDEGSSVVPVASTPDSVAPTPGFFWPADGAENVDTRSRFGISFDEMIDVLSAHEGSVRLYRADAETPDEGRVLTYVSAQESIINVHPRCALEPDTEYVLELPAGGVQDFSGNALAESVSIRIRTGVR